MRRFFCVWARIKTDFIKNKKVNTIVSRGKKKQIPNKKEIYIFIFKRVFCFFVIKRNKIIGNMENILKKAKFSDGDRNKCIGDWGLDFFKKFYLFFTKKLKMFLFCSIISLKLYPYIQEK